MVTLRALGWLNRNSPRLRLVNLISLGVELLLYLKTTPRVILQPKLSQYYILV